MRYKKPVIYIIYILFATLLGCEIFTEPDLTGKQVTIFSPPDGLETTISTQSFWWEHVEDAEQYNLQIVTPSFYYIERLFADTFITANKFLYTLLPGEYEWRVNALNFSSQTEYTVHKLIIDSTPDISHETIQLLLPVDKDTTNNTSITFAWELLYNADDYNFQLYYKGIKYLSVIWEFDTITKELDQGEGHYEWSVRGQNAFSNTAYSSRSLYIDTTSPNKPILLNPLNNEILPDTIINFHWDCGQISGSSIKDSLYIFGDQSMGQLLIAKYLSTPSYSDSLGPGEYYWRVRSIDAAGNKSDYSVLSHFTVK